MRAHALALLLPGLAAACSALGAEDLPVDPPPLADMEEPLALFQEPDDEKARRALPPGSFSGLYVEDARDSLDALAGEAPGVRAARIVENSPAAAAGIEEGDLVVEVDDGVEPRVLRATSQWREIELETPPGTTLVVVLERLGEEREVELVLEPRLAPAPRTAAPRVREERRVGVALRAMTEVEARAAGLGPGGGAVVVGLARGSPWRAAGVAIGDHVVEVDGEPLASPALLVERIETAPQDASLALELARGGERVVVDAPLSARESALSDFSVPLVVSWRRTPDRTRFSFLLGLVRWESTPSAWRMRLLWLIRFGGGDTDRLIEVDA